MRYRFDDHALDVDRRESLRGTRRIAVEPQVFDLLLHLIENRERVVSKDDLFTSVWQGRIVSGWALSTRINAARSPSTITARTSALSRPCRARVSALWGQVRVEHAAEDAISSPSRPPLALPDKPSIAVLPFTNLSGDPEQDYFTDGIVEDIITACPVYAGCS